MKTVWIYIVRKRRYRRRLPVINRSNLDFCAIKEKLKQILSEDLFVHSLGVSIAAKNLASRYGADPCQAALAGLVHDYGKQFSGPELKALAAFYNLKVDDVALYEPRLLHAPLGAILLKQDFAIKDEAVLQAVCYHTTGHYKMNLLDKIIYLADFIEPGRAFNGVDQVRALAEQNLNSALLAAVEQTIVSVIRRKLLLHPDSVSFRNAILLDGK